MANIVEVDYNITMPKHFDHTTLNTYQTCPRKFELFMLNGLIPKTQARSLSFGAAIHMGLDRWYRHINTPAEELRTKFKEDETTWLQLQAQSGIFNLTFTPVDEIPDLELRAEFAIRSALMMLPPLAESQLRDHRTHQLCEEMLRAYFKFYRYEPFEVLYVEQNFVLELADGINYSGIIDLTVKWMDKIFPVEHKTTSSLWNFDENFNPSQQVTGYITGLHSLVEEASKNCCVNALQIPKRKGGVQDSDFQRYPNIYRSEDQLREFIDNVVSTVESMRHDLRRGYFIMNTAACHQYGGCQYRPICKVSPGRERQIIIESFYEQKFWNPLMRDHLQDAPNKPTVADGEVSA